MCVKLGINYPMLEIQYQRAKENKIDIIELETENGNIRYIDTYTAKEMLDRIKPKELTK